MLWREAIVHRHHRATGKMAQAAAQHIVGLHTADGEATTVEVHEHGQAFGGWRIQARQQLGAVTGGHLVVLYTFQWLGRHVQHARTRGVGSPRLGGRQGMHGHMACTSNAFQHAAHGGS